LALQTSPARAGFTEASVAYGIANGDSMSYAAGFIDYDGDADADFFVNDHWQSPQFLYRNEGGLSFLDQSAHYLAGENDRHDQLWGDLDNDGDPDQYISHGREQDNELYWNNGNGTWVEGALAAGVEDFDGRGRELTFADFDLDGFLDMFLVNALRVGFPRPNVLFRNDGDGTFSRMPNADPLYATRLHASGADYDQDGYADILTTNPQYQPGELYRNDGDLTFTDVTATAFAGIVDPLLHAQGIAWGDYDDDGDLDLFTSSGNRGMWDHAVVESDSLRYYVEVDSTKAKTLSIWTSADSVTLSCTTADWQPVMCWYGAAGDSTTTFPLTVRLDDILGTPPDPAEGVSGLLLWALPDSGEYVVKLKIVGGGENVLKVGGGMRPIGSTVTSSSAENFDPPPAYATANWSNRLYRNEGDGTFTEVTSGAFAMNDSTFNSMGATWGDYDNDGSLDLYVSNGGTIVTGNEPNVLYRNNGDGTFTDVAAAEGVQGSTRGMTDGAAWGDVDGDGFLDLYVDHGAEHPPFGVGPRELFMNSPNGNHWLKLDLRGLGSDNGSGIGARVRVVTESEERWRTVLGESENCFSGGTTVHFGLGTDTICQSVRVIWPSGATDTHFSVGVDQHYVAVKGRLLRLRQNPHLEIDRGPIAVELAPNSLAFEPVPLDNQGGLACYYTVRLEDCSGEPASWMTMSADSGGVWPGGDGGNSLQLAISSTGLGVGLYCGRVIFESNSTQGPDTLDVSLEVIDSGLAVAGPVGLPLRFELGPPRPNPTSQSTVLSLALASGGEIRVSVYDIQGRTIVTLLDRWLPAGFHEVVWDGRNPFGRRVASGVYFLRASQDGSQAVRKVLILN
jgi:hypothetical protein